MNAFRWAVTGLTIVTLLGACGGDDEEGPKPQSGTPNQQAASTTTDTTIGAVRTVVSAPSGGQQVGQTSALQLASAAQSAQSAITAPTGAAQSGLSLAGLDPLTLGPQADPPGTGGCTCTETSCTFQACTIGQVTIDGSYSWGGGRLECKGLKYTIKSASPGFTSDVVVTLDCDITATKTSIDGSLRSQGKTATGVGDASYTSEWDTSLQFENVTFPESGGKATAGSVHVSGTVTVGVAGHVQSYTGAYDVTFPAN